MIQKEFILQNRLGLHIRPAALFTKVASRYKSDVFLVRDRMRVNAKSIMGVMMLAAGHGTRLTMECMGEDEDALCAELTTLIENKFNEE